MYILNVLSLLFSKRNKENIKKNKLNEKEEPRVLFSLQK